MLNKKFFIYFVLSLLIIALIIINFFFFPASPWPFDFLLKKKKLSLTCPFSKEEVCKNVSKIKVGKKEQYCYKIDSIEKVLAPLEGSLDYGRISYNPKPGEGPFFEAPLIIANNEKNKVRIIYSGTTFKEKGMVRQGEEIGETNGSLLPEKECSLILEIEKNK